MILVYQDIPVFITSSISGSSPHNNFCSNYTNLIRFSRTIEPRSIPITASAVTVSDGRRPFRLGGGRDRTAPGSRAAATDPSAARVRLDREYVS